MLCNGFWNSKDIVINVQESNMAGNAEQLQKIFVGGLNKDADENSLTEAFNSYGRIMDVSVLRDSGGRSRGFGFVVFESAESVDNIMKTKKEGTVFHVSGTPVEVKRALPKIDRSDMLRERGAASKHSASVGVKKVFVGGLASTINSEDLERYFSQYGKILEATVLMDKMTARSRGFGFVVFEDEDVADKVCALRNHTIDGKITEVRKAEPRSVLLNRKEKDTVNHFAFQNHADVARQQQTPQTTALDVGNLNSAIQMLNSLQKLLSAAQLQQLLNQNATLPNQGLAYGMTQFQGPGTNVPMQSQLPSSNQNSILQLLQAALASQNPQGGVQNVPVNAHANSQLSNFLGNPAPDVSANTSMNALGLLSSLANIGQQSSSNIKQEASAAPLNQSAAISSLPGASNANPGFSPYDDVYATSSQSSSAYGPVRAPARSDPKSTTYRPY